MIRAFLIGAVALYLIVAMLAWWQQDRLLYPAPPASATIPSGVESVIYRTSDGLDLRAGYRRAQSGKPTILYFHGNGADWQSSVRATDLLVTRGYGLLAAEYRGYSGNPGKPSEHGFYRDGRAAVAFLADRGVASRDIVIVGNSIGSGTAVQMASEVEAKALVLISPFANLQQLVRDKISWLPTNLLLRDTYDNVGKIGSLGESVAILHGADDQLIPIAHSRQLQAEQPTAKFVEIRGVGHELAWQPAAQEAMLEFLRSL